MSEEKIEKVEVEETIEETPRRKSIFEREVGPNATAPIVKRILSGFFDMIALFFLQMGLYFLVSLTPINSKVTEYQEELIVLQDSIKLDTGYGEKFYYPADYNTGNYHLYEDDQGKYIVQNVTFTNDEERDTITNKYKDAINNSEEYGQKSMNYKVHSFLIYAVLTGGILEAVYFIAIPLIKNNGQTPGMMLCGIRYISTADYEKPKWYQYLFRFLFIYVIESLLPYFLIGYIGTMVIVPVILIIVLFTNKKRMTVHDFVARTMAIEKITFVSNEDIIEAEEDK